MNLGNVIVAVGMLLSEIIDEDDDQHQRKIEGRFCLPSIFYMEYVEIK